MFHVNVPQFNPSKFCILQRTLQEDQLIVQERDELSVENEKLKETNNMLINQLKQQKVDISSYKAQNNALRNELIFVKQHCEREIALLREQMQHDEFIAATNIDQKGKIFN